MIRHFNITLAAGSQNTGLKLRIMMLATKHHITGFVEQKSNKIFIEAEGDENEMDVFLTSLKKNHPEMSENTEMQKKEPGKLSYFDEFIIK